MEAGGYLGRMITVDYANCTTDRVGEHGLDPASLAAGSPSFARAGEITRDLASTRGTGWERWRDLCSGAARDAHVGAVKAIAWSPHHHGEIHRLF